MTESIHTRQVPAADVARFASTLSYGSLPEDCTVDGDAAAYDTAKATELFGWEPARSWRDAAEEDVPAPAV
jgi:hypothetical protein